MSVHHLHEDFFRFTDALATGEGDPWELYCRHYLDPNRPALDAWWSQVLALPSRAGVYLGWQIVRDFLASEQEGFDSDAEVVLRSAGFAAG